MPRLIIHQPTVLFSQNKSAASNQPTVLFPQNKSAASNQPTVLFSQNKSAPAISHQPNEQADQPPLTLSTVLFFSAVNSSSDFSTTNRSMAVTTTNLFSSTNYIFNVMDE
jgi:hypothetical protein